MLRRTIVALTAALLLGSLLTVARPASAVEYQPWGRAVAADQVLKPGCRHYPFVYRYRHPADTWAVEIFLVGPRGGRVGSAAFLGPEDPRDGRGRWRICRASVSPGRFTMKMRVTVVQGYDRAEAWVRPSYFRLTRRR